MPHNNHPVHPEHPVHPVHPVNPHEHGHSKHQETLYVVACISNPIRFSSRYKLYKQFEKYIKSFDNVELFTIEQAFGDRDFQITERANPNHIQVRTEHELWHKENMLNLAIHRLPHNWKYVAWIDADVSFARPDWVHETLHQLQHHHVVQMFSHAMDLGPNYEPIKTHNGFCYSYHNQDITPPWDKGYNSWHPGFAWAITREAFDAVGGLIDWAILGSGDRHMSLGLIGRIETSFFKDMWKHCPDYARMLQEWQARADAFIKKDIGYVEGLLLHYWHGKKKDRGYSDRWKIITDNKFNPLKDIKRDWQGLWQLNDGNIALRDGIRRYFRSRNEDSLDKD
jgi:hypothetical protein